MGKFVAIALIIAAVIMIGKLSVTGDSSTSLKTGITNVTGSTNQQLSDMVD